MCSQVLLPGVVDGTVRAVPAVHTVFTAHWYAGHNADFDEDVQVRPFITIGHFS